MISLAPLNSLAPDDLAHLEQGYCHTFPRDERRPWTSLISPDHSERMHPYAVYHDSDLIGFLVLWDVERWCFVEYLMTLTEWRGRGLGALILRTARHITARHRPFLLEVEPPTTSTLAQRRIAFYERSGLRLQPFDYIQPAYTNETKPIPLCLMSTRDITPDEYPALVRSLHSTVYST